jgi:hypothetical protein
LGLVVLGLLTAGFVWALVQAWRARVVAAYFPAVRANAVRHLLPLAEAALRARRLLERARNPEDAAALEPGIAELLRLAGGMRGLAAAGGALWLTGARAEVAAARLWSALDQRLNECLGADDLAAAVAGDAAGLERLHPRLRRWLRGEPGPDAELWLLAAFGEVLAAEVRGLDRLGAGKRGVARRELRRLRQRLGPVPPGLPDGDALAEALEDYLASTSSSTPRTSSAAPDPACARSVPD